MTSPSSPVRLADSSSISEPLPQAGCFGGGGEINPDLPTVKTMEVWADPNNETAWDYIGVIDTTLTSSRVDIYRYEDRFVEGAAFPRVHGSPAWSRASASGLTSPETIPEVLQPLIEFVNSTVPPEQLARTPLYLYGSGSFRTMDNKAQHNLLQAACEFVKSHSSNLVSDCSKHVSWIEGYQQAILSWTAANYLAGTLDDAQRAFGVLDVTPSGVHMAFHLSADKTKTDLYRLGLRAANNTALYTDLHADYYDLVDRLEAEQIAACLPRGSQLFGIDGAGNYTQCRSAVGDFFQPLLESVTPVTEPVTFYAVNGFESYYTKFNKDEKAIEKSCNGDDSDETTACLEAVIAQQVLEQLGTLPNVTIQYDPSIDETPVEWTMGRALLYADVDLSKNGGQRIGIHENVGSKIWRFGQTDTVARPTLNGGKGDWVDRLDSRSHRLWGGIILLVGLAAIIYLLLGRSARNRIWTAVSRSAKPRGWQKVPATDENYELDDVALGDDADEDFEV